MSPSREEALFDLALEKPAGKCPALLDAMCEGDDAQSHRLAQRFFNNRVTDVSVGQGNGGLMMLNAKSEKIRNQLVAYSGWLPAIRFPAPKRFLADTQFHGELLP
jgi:hypothetical protein